MIKISDCELYMADEVTTLGETVSLIVKGAFFGIIIHAVWDWAGMTGFKSHAYTAGRKAYTSWRGR